MAKAVGVRVVKLDCTQISLGYSGEKACEKALMATPAFAELLRAGARELPLTRNELLKLALQDGAPDEVARAHIETERRHATTTEAILEASRSQSAAGDIPEGVQRELEPEPEAAPGPFARAPEREPCGLVVQPNVSDDDYSDDY